MLDWKRLIKEDCTGCGSRRYWVRLCQEDTGFGLG